MSRQSEMQLPAGWRVKPLEWAESEHGRFQEAKTSLGVYEAGTSDDGYAWADCDGPSMWEWRPEDDARLLTEDDAKAAAQAEYEAAILAALEQVPA